MRRLLALFLASALLLSTVPSWAAIALVSSLMTTGCTEQLSDTSLSCTTINDLDANNVGVFVFATDNQCNTTGTQVLTNQNEHTTATISGNSMTKIIEACSDIDCAAGSGGTVSVWVYRATGTLTTGATVVFNTSGAVTAKVEMGREFSVTSGNTLVSAGGEQTGAYDSVDVGSLSISGLANQEYLFLRASAHEGDDGVNWTVTTNYTGWSVPISADGSGSASMVANAEHRVFTGTGDTSDPTNLGDHTTVYVALKEQAPAATSKPIAPIIFQ